jgi:chitinase
MKLFRFTLLTIFCLQGLIGKGHAQPVVGGYYENWSQYRPGVGGRPVFFPNLIDPTILTDLYFAFGVFGFVTRSIDPNNPHLTGDYTIQPVEWNDQSVLYPQCMALKTINPNLHVHLSIGGWSFNDPSDPMGSKTYHLFSQMVSSSANRQEFINSAIAYAHQYGFDGIDIDWEYPGDTTRGGSPADFENFITFLSECSIAFKAATPPLSLTYTPSAIVPTGISQSPSTYFSWLARCAPYLDMLNIMAYDYHGPFDNPQLTGVNAPLNRDTNPSSNLYVAKTLENYLTYGVPADKMILGLPTYGHTYGGVSDLTPTDNGPGKPFTKPGDAGPATLTPGFLAYFEISDMIAEKRFVFGTDTLTNTAYGYNLDDRQWASFDTPETIQLKAKEALNNNLKGVMVWAVDDDEYAWGAKYPNTRSAYNVMYPSDPVQSTPTNHVRALPEEQQPHGSEAHHHHHHHHRHHHHHHHSDVDYTLSRTSTKSSFWKEYSYQREFRALEIKYLL